jgi:excisionase family DNA binding protein
MDHLEYEYPDHILLVKASEFEKEIIRGVFGKEPLPRPVVEVEAKRTWGCNPVILTALNEIKNGLQELQSPASAPERKPPESFDLVGAAAHLGMSPRKLRELVKAKRIACTRIDYRHFLFTQADLNEFLATYRTKPKRI